LGVDTTKGVGAMTQDNSSLEQGLTLQGVHMGDDKNSAADVSEYDDEDSTFYIRSSIGESICQHDRDFGSYESHYLEGKLKVSEDMIMTTIRHIDNMHKLVADCYWRDLGAHDSL
jgi:hypothetical protein